MGRAGSEGDFEQTLGSGVVLNLQHTRSCFLFLISWAPVFSR